MAEHPSQRVLIISSNSSGRGGGERYLVNLVLGLDRLGCEVHSLLGEQRYMDGLAEMHAQAGAAVHRLPLTALAERPLRFVQSMLDLPQHRRIARFCAGLRPAGIVVCQQYDEDGLDYLAGASVAHVAPVVGVLHMPMTRDKHRRPLGRWRGLALKRWYARNPYRLALTSSGAQQEFESYYPAPRPTRVVRTGVDFKPMDRSCVAVDGWHDDPELPVVGFAGQFVPQKRLDVLVHGWMTSRRGGLDSRLLLVGDGPERERVEALLAEVPRDRWHVTGWTNAPETYLARIDVFAMTSDFEGLPLALVEAAGSGRPAVVRNFNGASDVAERAPWVSVVSQSDTHHYAAALTRALVDLAALTDAARAGQSAFQVYHSVEAMAHDLLDVLGLT